jgi:hypothetical protein
LGGVHGPPQLAVLGTPQLSLAGTSPQSFMRRVQNAVSLSGVHPQTFWTPPPPQVCGNVHGPQSAVLAELQLSVPETGSQFLFSRAQKAALVSGVQHEVPEQTCPGEQHEPRQTLLGQRHEPSPEHSSFVAHGCAEPHSRQLSPS